MMRALTLSLLLAVGAACAATPAHAQDVGSATGFRPGDRVLLAVAGEAQLTDTFTVVSGPAIELPGIGAMSLAGVPRSGIEPYLAGQLGRYLVRPTVHARALLRLQVVGEVVRPGFYAIPADALLSDAMMEAGGLTQEAKVGAMSIVRVGTPVWQGSKLQEAISDGRTLDELGVLSGDALLIPRKKDPESTARIISIMVALPVAVFGITRLF